MTTRPVTGPPAYLAAHRVAVVDERLPFELAYCLSRLVIEHGGGPFIPERKGTMSLKVFEPLVAEDLALLTSEFSERLRPEVELAISALLVQELGSAPPVGLRITGYRPSRRKIDRYVEATESGVELVAGALRAIAHDRCG